MLPSSVQERCLPPHRQKCPTEETQTSVYKSQGPALVVLEKSGGKRNAAGDRVIAPSRGRGPVRESDGVAIGVVHALATAEGGAEAEREDEVGRGHVRGETSEEEEEEEDSVMVFGIVDGADAMGDFLMIDLVMHDSQSDREEKGGFDCNHHVF